MTAQTNGDFLKVGEAQEAIEQILVSTLTLQIKSRFFYWSALADKRPKASEIFNAEYVLLDEMCDQLAKSLVLIDGHLPAINGVFAGFANILDDEVPSAESNMLLRLASDHIKIAAELEACQKYLNLAHPVQQNVSSMLSDMIMSHQACVEGLQSEAGYGNEI